MQTYLDCIPCFFRQAIESSRMVGLSPRKQKKVVDELGSMLSEISLISSPPEVARMVNKILQKNSNEPDSYTAIKQKSNYIALSMYDKLKRKVNFSKSKLLTAVEVAIIGNVIDYGAKNHLDVDAELEDLLNEEEKAIKLKNKKIFNYGDFYYQLQRSKTILYLADNAGETVFDRVLIETIKQLDKTKKIIYAVKEKPVINDALRKDALTCGIDQSAEIISSGCDAPGTVLSLCSKEFLTIYKKADMIISKGQGNFEALSECNRPIFFY